MGGAKACVPPVRLFLYLGHSLRSDPQAGCHDIWSSLSRLVIRLPVGWAWSLPRGVKTDLERDRRYYEKIDYL